MERTEREALLMLRSLKAIQEQAGAAMPCPRCGLDDMDSDPGRNPMSGQANVHICPRCRTWELFRAQTGFQAKLLHRWAVFEDWDNMSYEEYHQIAAGS